MTEAAVDLLALAPPDRHASLHQALGAPDGPPFVLRCLDLEGEGLPDTLGQLVLWVCPTPPATAAVRSLVARAAPTPVVLVLDPAGQPPAIEDSGLAGCLHLDAALAEGLTAIWRRLQRTRPPADLLQNVLARVPEPLLVVDSAGQVLAANPPFARLTGHATDAVVGCRLAELAPAAVSERLHAADRGEWRLDGIRLPRRGGGESARVDIRASVVRLGAARATWLLRCHEREAPMTPQSPAGAAGAIDALARMAQAAGSRVGGAQVRIIGLDRARRRLGEKWPRLQQHIALVCESTISHDLGAGDVFMKTKTGDYLLCFACIDEAEADRRAARLQARIDERLFGQDAQGLADLGVDRGHRALDEVAIEVDAAVLPTDDASPATLSERFADEFAERRRRRLVELNRRLEQLQSAGSLEVRPMVTPRRVPAQLLRAVWEPADRERLKGLAERAGRLDELRLTLDLRRLALIDAAESEGVFDSASVILDLHITTIERRKSWDALLPVIQELAGSTRRWLVPNLVGVPTTIYPGRLRDALVTLKPFSRSQTVTLAPDLLASFDLALLPCRLYMLDAEAAAAVAATELPRRIRERLAIAGAKLAIDGGTADLAHRFGAALRTVEPAATVPA